MYTHHKYEHLSMPKMITTVSEYGMEMFEFHG